jgi:hypothetical protein
VSNRFEISLKWQWKVIKICTKIVPRRSQIIKNRPLGLSWTTLGTLLAPRWRRGDNKRFKKLRIYDFWVVQVLRMDQKSIQNVTKNCMFFNSDFETCFSRSWVDFVSKKLFKMRGIGVVFSTSLRICEECDFEQHFIVFAIF